MKNLLVFLLFCQLTLLLTGSSAEEDAKSDAYLSFLQENHLVRKARSADPGPPKGKKAQKKGKKNGKKKVNTGKKGKKSAVKGKKLDAKKKGNVKKNTKKGKKGGKKTRAVKGKKSTKGKGVKKAKKSENGKQGKKAQKGSTGGKVKKGKGKGKKKGKKTKGKKAGKKKGKKGKKTKKTKNNIKKGKKGKKLKKKTQKNTRQDTCEVSDECLANAVSYLNTLKDRVKNYNNQMKRIIRQNTTAYKKSLKRIEFDIVHTRLMNAAGGNRSDLKCGDSLEGKAQVKNLSATLDNCNSDIETSCDLSSGLDLEEMEACKVKMDEFETMVLECTSKEDAELCDCWTNPAIGELRKSFATCALSKEAGDTATGLFQCLDTFGKCRKYEDVVGRYIYACDLDIQEVVSKLKNIQANRGALESAIVKVADISASRRRLKKETVESCADVTTVAGKLIKIVDECPVNPDIKVLADNIRQFKETSCPTADKENVAGIKTKLDEALETLQNIETEYQIVLEDLTSSTASPEAINSAETYVAAGCVSNEEAETTTAATNELN